MLGFPILCSSGLRLLGFQLFGFYEKGFRVYRVQGLEAFRFWECFRDLKFGPATVLDYPSWGDGGGVRLGGYFIMDMWCIVSTTQHNLARHVMLGSVALILLMYV